ncbi:MAG: hypothetical protein II982_04255, partial [Clostridia bacterium]|nr:hypothetical protein [Clostridia bacterium]
TTTVEGLLLSANANKGQVVVGDTTYNVFGTSMPTFYKDGGVVYTAVGDTVKLYLDAAGYVVAGVVRESDTEYDLNLGMVIDATDDMDRFGNTTATITVLKFDGTEETLTIDTVEETYETDNKVCVIPDRFAAYGADEYVFAYDSVARDYAIVGNYVHYEVDAYDKLVDRIVAVDNYGTITPSNSVKDYEVVTYDGSETYKLCYNADNGFFTSDDGLRIKASLEEVASNFTGMYYEKDAETGEVKTEYYTASNIPEFDRSGKVTLVKCDDKIVAMMVLESPAAQDEAVFGVFTDWAVTYGEAYKNGKPTYRYAVTMLVDGESRTYYTEDLLAEEINAIDIDYDALYNANGLQTDYFATLHLEDGKIIVTYDNKLDVTYLCATDVNYAVATTIRGEYISAKNVNSWTNEVVEGWTTDVDGKSVYIPYSYDGEISFRTTTTLKLCNETKIITISGALTDFDGTNFAEATDGLFQKTFASKISAGGDIKITDEYDGNNYIFVYTIFPHDYKVVDNRGCLDTVLVFEKPVVTRALEKPDITDTGYPLSIGKVISAYDETDRWDASIINASLTVVGLDGTEKTLSVETAQENTCVFEGGASKWKDTTDRGEIFFDYTLDTDYSDGNDSDYTIVGNYIHYEVDEITGKIIRIVALDNYATITPSNSVKDYEVVTYDGTEEFKLCYNADNGFFTSADGLRVKALLEEVDANFRGMYYEKDTETGEVKTEYYTASNIPEFDRSGKVTLVKCDDKIVAMMVLVPPDTKDDKALGIITGWNTVGGEAEKNGKPTYRYAVTMLVNGESQTYYTEDLLGTELNDIDITYDALDNAKGLQTDYFATLNLKDGKIVVENNVLDVTYLGANEVNYAIATRIRNTTINGKAVTSWEVPVVEGWIHDAEGNPVYIPEGMGNGGKVVVGDSITLYACDETKYVYINSALTDFDGTNFGEATDGLFQKTAVSKVSVGEGVEVSEYTDDDWNNDLYYIFAYTTFPHDYKVLDNQGCLDTVFVFTAPVEPYDYI